MVRRKTRRVHLPYWEVSLHGSFSMLEWRLSINMNAADMVHVRVIDIGQLLWVARGGTIVAIA